MLSVVVPAYNEEQTLLPFAQAISQLLQGQAIAYEIIFVNDGSTDNTWGLIQQAEKQNPHVRGLAFSRNFGKEAAIFAGLSASQGDCAVILDCDFQHPPEMILEMYQLWQQGYEVVEGRKKKRGKESVLHRWAANCFYWLITKASGVDMARTSDYKLLDRKAVDALLSMPEQHIFFRALSAWIGFKTVSIDYIVQPSRRSGSHWSSFSLVKYAIRNIASFSTAPMQIITFLGGFAFLLTVVLGIQTLLNWAGGQALEGFTTVILLLLIIGSILMISLGIIGYYIARIYDEVKGRPKYIVSSRIGFEERERP